MPPSAQTINTDSAKPPRKRRTRLWITLIFITLTFAWFARFAYLRITLRPTPRPEYWQQKIADLCPSTPGALTAQVAADIFKNRPWEARPGIVRDPDTGQRYGGDVVLIGPWDESRPDMAAFTAIFNSTQYGDAAGKTEQAIAAGWESRLTGNDHYYWSYWFLAHARWAKDHKGDMETAVTDWLNCFGLCRQIGRTPCVREQILASRIIGRTAREMICTAQEPYPEIDARRLAAVIDEVIGPPKTPDSFLAGERYVMYSRLESTFVRENGSWLDVSKAVQSMQQGSFVPLSVPRIWNMTSPLFSDLISAREKGDAWMSRLKTLAGDGPPEFSPGWIESDLSVEFDVLDGLPFHEWESPRILNCLRAYFEMRCQLRAATAMLALAEYHRDRGHFPERLEELVPEYLARVPIDYAVLQPLRYHRAGERYVLYSVGQNGFDDGGVDNSSRRFGGPPLDIVYSHITRDRTPNDNG